MAGQDRQDPGHRRLILCFAKNPTRVSGFFSSGARPRVNTTRDRADNWINCVRLRLRPGRANEQIVTPEDERLMPAPAEQPVGPTPTPLHDLKRAALWPGALLLLFLMIGLLPSSDFGIGRYLPLHTAMETGAIVVAMLVFGIVWNAYSDERPGNVVLLGVVLLGTALLDFGHMLGYRGMPDFITPASPQKAIVFWLAARLLVAAGLLVAALRPWQPMLETRHRYRLLAGVLAYVALLYALELLTPDHLPAFFVPGSGLTPLKVAFEYGLVLIYGAAALVFAWRAMHGAAFNAADLFAASAVAMLSELCFTRYVSVSDSYNFIGHLYKIISYGFIYRAVFVESVRQPFQALSRALENEKHWAAEQHSLVRTLDMLEEAVIELRPDGTIINANSGWWQLAGRAPGTYPLLDSVHPEDQAAFAGCLNSLADGTKDEFHGRFRFVGDAAYERWMECRFVTELTDAGKIVGIRGVLRDITKTYLQERHIAHMALHDALTGLPNRVLLEDRVCKTIQLARRNQDRVAVCFIDLDHFKNINDAYGHKAGDALLLSMAQALEKNLRDGDTVARWGGDEFVALLPGIVNIEDARQVARKLQKVMPRSFAVAGQPINATFSMGIAMFPDDGDSVESLLAHADRAMFYAKSQGRNNFQLFSEMSAKGLGKKELYIQAKLADAIQGGQIEVWFQPQVRTERDAEGRHRLVGIEALARWHDKDLGWISPATFIPMAESLGLIADLGQRVTTLALAQFQRWHARRPELHLSLNISKRQLFAPEFVSGLIHEVSRHDLPTSAIVLEITESVALLEVEFAEERLRQLVDAGFILSIDDFGTGYASLSQLHELPVQELKIDISFVQRVHTPDGLRILQAIVQLGRALGLRTVAEGVEDAQTATTLRELEVDTLQGYHFGRPVPARVLEELPAFADQD